LRFDIDNDCLLEKLIDLSKEFHVKNSDKNKSGDEEWAIDIWTDPRFFDLVLEYEGESETFPKMITVPSRRWDWVVFGETDKETRKSLSYFLKIGISTKVGSDYHKDFKSKVGKDGKADNFEIILESGQRFSFLQRYGEPLSLAKLRINRWSKLKYKIEENVEWAQNHSINTALE
jgi:hypothetical protein